jgi:hypothetical protein
MNDKDAPKFGPRGVHLSVAKIRSSDGGSGIRLFLGTPFWYHFHGFEGYPTSVGYFAFSGGIQMDSEKIKQGLWGAAGGAVVLAVIGFTWGGWVTGGTAQKMAEEMAENAVVDRLAPICVEQFNQGSEKVQKLKELKETDTWKRDDYVAEQGWATMPGEKEFDRKIADKCAEMIMQLGQ